MYLSRLTLNARDRLAREWLGDCHMLHRAIMTGFPQVDSTKARAELGVLFRVEAGPFSSVIRVLVQSRAEPRWAFETPSVQPEPAIALDGLAAGFVPGAPYRFRLRANPTRRVHQRATLGKDLRELDIEGNWREPGELPEETATGIVRRDYVEPAHAWRVREDGRRIGKRVELRREEDRIAWLQRKGRHQCGFELVTARLVAGIGGGPARDYLAARADPSDPLGGRINGQHTRMDARLTFATALFEGELRVTDGALFRQAFETGIGPAKAFGCGLLSLAPRAP
jgi:CRISPR system Cascade subunit CasE